MKEWPDMVQQVQEFLRAWFCRRDASAAAGYLSEDVYLVGTGSGEIVDGLPAMRVYLDQDCKEEPNPFRIVVLHPGKQRVSAECGSVSLEIILQNSRYSWRLRTTFLLRMESGSWRICHIHVSEASDKQRYGEHYPQSLILETLSIQREELLNDATAGGMMGGYIEPGFPFYFINHRMLEYLGYSTQDEFIRDNSGMISNCMHPGDRRQVDQEVARQIALAGEYTVEYRMRKMDGSYIWVRDVGRAITAENGKPAIISVCIDTTDLHTAQEERKQLLNTIPGAVFRCRYAKGLEVLETSDGLFDITGLSREEFAEAGNRLTALFPPEDGAAILPAFDRQMASGMRDVYVECRLLQRGDGVRWVGLRGHLLFQDSSERILFCVLTDITQQAQERQRILTQYQRESQYAMELAAPNLIGKGTANLTKNIFEFYSGLGGRAAEALYLSVTMDESIRRLSESAASPEDSAAFLECFGRENLLSCYARGETDRSIEFRRKWADGKFIWCKTVGRIHLMPGSGDLAVFLYSFDITEDWMRRKLLEQASTIGYDYLADVDMINDCYYLSCKTPDLEEISSKGVFTEALSKTTAPLISEPFRSEFFRQLDFDHIRARLELEPSFSFTLPLRINGKLRHKKFTVAYIDKIMGHVCISRTDITDIIDQEQRQREALLTALQAAEQASVAKSGFLSRMSHEIRTPLNAIIGMTAIAAGSVEDPEEISDCLDKIGLSSRFLLTLINDILDMSRIESGKMLLKSEPFSLEQTISYVSNIIRVQAIQKGVEFECIAHAGIGDSYTGDQLKLQQVLMNILSNAVKFTEAGGKVTFSAMRLHRTKDTASLRFVITDTGIGISPAFLPHIFDPFAQESGGTTSAYSGTGLGLAISKSIVDMMNGHIGVHSIQAVGSEFTVDVHLTADAEEPRQRQAPRFADWRALVVDDDAAVCQSTSLILQEMGMSVEWVNSGPRALERVQELLLHRRHFDAVIMDWKMPEMDGIETARQLRQMLGPDVTVLIMTAYDCAALEEEAHAAGVDLLVSKPIFRSSLEAALEQTRKEKPAGHVAAAKGPYDFSGKRILLAEDHPLNTEIAVKLLRRVGLVVDAAPNGQKVLELFNASKLKYYDGILMDIRMPVMDGLTATAKIRSLPRPDAASIPIIAMTANAFEDDVDKSLAAGMNAHLAKPIEPELLYRTLHDFMYSGKEGSE